MKETVRGQGGSESTVEVSMDRDTPKLTRFVRGAG